MKRKNNAPQNCPHGIALKTLGKVTKRRLGPLSGFTPKLKQAGKMIKPEIRATAVSKIVINTASPVSERSLAI